MIHMYIKTSSYNLNMYSFNSSIAATAAAKSLQSCLTLCDPRDGSPTRLCRPWDSPGKNTGVGCHFLLQIHLDKHGGRETLLCLLKKKTFIFINFWLPWVFTAMLGLVWLQPVGATPHCCTQASHCSGFSC